MSASRKRSPRERLTFERSVSLRVTLWRGRSLIAAWNLMFFGVSFCGETFAGRLRHQGDVYVKWYGANERSGVQVMLGADKGATVTAGCFLFPMTRRLAEAFAYVITGEYPLAEGAEVDAETVLAAMSEAKEAANA